MNKLTASAVALLASTALVQAGGVDRNQASPRILFESGTYVELGYVFVSPDVSGTALGASSGDMAPSYGTAVLSYRQDLTDELSFGLILDQPIGADVSYPTGTGYTFAGSTAEISSQQITVAMRYELNDNFSVYGGLRALSADGQASVTPLAYTLDVSSDYELGYMLGAAYEIPEIALRVALTYYSSVDLEFSGTENGAASTFDVEVPQSVLLEAQSGIAPGTLLFGSIRWTEWTEFVIAPPTYVGITGANLVDYDDDIFTFTIGVGRQLNENWSVTATITHEPQTEEFTGNLGPRDGLTTFGIGAEYTNGAMSIAGGVSYGVLGDATTIVNGAPLVTSSFTDNTIAGAGIRIGYQF